jgi:hypothetical protein
LLLFFHPPHKKEESHPEIPVGGGESWRKAGADAQSIQPAQSEKIERPQTDIT